MIAMAQAEPWFETGSVHVGFVADKVALGQVSLRVIRGFPSNIIPPRLSTLVYHLEDKHWVRWWLQFRDIVSLHPYEQQEVIYNCL
jgi:hypothetical protein